MKIAYYFIVSVILSVGILSSCQDLSYNEVQINDEEWVFENYQQVDRLLIDVYAHIRYDLGFDMGSMTSGYNGAMLSSATDESDYSQSLSWIHRYYNGAWSSVNSFPDTWVNSYQAIYEANDFLEKLDKVFATLEEYKHNVSGAASYPNLLAKFELYPYQARFLRAYFHFELAKTYGNVPLVTKTLTPGEANMLERTPVQSVFQFIVDECDAIVEKLPITYASEPDQQMGRINRPMVLALKARTLLYAASPLHNPANPKEAWRKAAEANKQLIDYCPGWGITLSPYNTLWGPNNHYNTPEIIFVRRISNSRNFEIVNYPVGNENAMGGNCPTQNLVDAYEYSNAASGNLRGKTWPQAEAEGILPDDPYINLDPRFALTVARNGNTWPTVAPYNQTPLQTFEGGRNGQPLPNATKTGYYLKKYVDGTRNITTANPNTSYHSWIIYRLGEFYLNYAEAMFHYMDRDATAKSDGILNMSANDAINALRNRTDISMPLFGPETNGDNWEERYMRERMVELAFEGHRFWDVRRWKKGAEYFTEIKTVTVANDGAVTRGPIINRLWNERNNLYPIPFDELKKAPNLIQNPGWGIN
jgi:hypothetical protein